MVRNDHYHQSKRRRYALSTFRMGRESAADSRNQPSSAISKLCDREGGRDYDAIRPSDGIGLTNGYCAACNVCLMDQGLLIKRPKGPYEGERMVIIVQKAIDPANTPPSLVDNLNFITGAVQTYPAHVTVLQCVMFWTRRPCFGIMP